MLIQVDTKWSWLSVAEALFVVLSQVFSLDASDSEDPSSGTSGEFLTGSVLSVLALPVSSTQVLFS